MQLYRSALLRVFNKEVDWDSDNICVTLHTSSYSPNLDTHAYVSDLSSELATGSGYTLGGVRVTAPTRTFTAANSWVTTRANSTAYALNKVVRPASANGFLYQCVVAGTSGGSVPTFPTTVGVTVADGGVTWSCVGQGVVVFAAANVQWPGATFSGVRYLVLSDRTPATAATQPLLAVHDYGSNQAGAGGVFTHSWESPDGILHFFTP